MLSVNTSLFPAGSIYRAADNGYPKYDLAKAKQLVAQAAPNHGGVLTIPLVDITDPRQAEIIQALGSMWQAAGFKVTLNQIEQVTYIDNLVGGQFQAAADEQFSAPRPRPQLRVAEPHHGHPAHRPELRPQQGPENRGGAADRAGPTSDKAARIEAYQTVDKLLARRISPISGSPGPPGRSRGTTR